MTWGERRPGSPRSPVCVAGACVGGLTKRRRVLLQLAVDQPEVAVTVMQGFRMRWVAEPDYLDDVFQRELEKRTWPSSGSRNCA